MTAKARARRALVILVRAFSAAVFLVGIGFTVWAVVQWLQTARWQPLTVRGALNLWPATRDWMVHPRSWLGLHRLLVRLLGVPVFVVLTLTGGVLLLLSTEAPREKRVRYY